MRSVLVLVPLVLLACNPSPTAQPQQPADTDAAQPVVEPDKGEPVAVGEVKLSPLQTSVEVPVGTTLLYSFKSHGSVGFGAAQQIDDPSVLKFVRTDTAYEQSEEERAGKAGADAATGTFVFEAVGVGTAKLTVDEMFRGEIEQSTTFTIVVSES